MPMRSDVEDLNRPLVQFALFALGHAAQSVVPGGGPLVPFAMTQSGEKPDLHRFAGDLEVGQEQAREYVRQAGKLRRAAVAWDGFLTFDGRRTDAVFVEASGDGEPQSMVLAQPYRKVGFIRKRTEAIGDSVLVGSGAPLF